MTYRDLIDLSEDDVYGKICVIPMADAVAIENALLVDLETMPATHPQHAALLNLMNVINASIAYKGWDD